MALGADVSPEFMPPGRPHKRLPRKIAAGDGGLRLEVLSRAIGLSERLE
jgi:hypothetical protein